MVSSWSVLRSYKSMVVECSIAVWICVACVCRDMRALEIVELDATSAKLKFENNFKSSITGIISFYNSVGTGATILNTNL